MTAEQTLGRSRRWVSEAARPTLGMDAAASSHSSSSQKDAPLLWYSIPVPPHAGRACEQRQGKDVPLVPRRERDFIEASFIYREPFCTLRARHHRIALVNKEKHKKQRDNIFLLNASRGSPKAGPEELHLRGKPINRIAKHLQRVEEKLKKCSRIVAAKKLGKPAKMPKHLAQRPLHPHRRSGGVNTGRSRRLLEELELIERRSRSD